MARKSPQKPASKARAKAPAKRKTTDPDQYKRFVELARELGADESPAAFDRAFKKVVTRKRAGR